MAQAIQFVKCFGVNFVAIHFLAAKFAIKRVEIQAMFAGNQRIGFFQIGAQFIRRARLARIIAGGDESAAERAAEIFKAAHIVALPAVQRDGDLREGFQRVVNVHAEGGVTFLGQRKRFGNAHISSNEMN